MTSRATSASADRSPRRSRHRHAAWGLLGAGFYLTYRSPVTVAAAAGAEVSGDDCGCEMPKTNRAGKRMLWGATGLVAVALLFPYFTPYLF